MNLLFIGGPCESLPVLGRAKALGYNVYVIDGDCQAPGIKWARKYGKYAIASTYEKEEVLRATRQWVIDGVLAVACDIGPTVSYVAMNLQLPHVPYELAILSWDKSRLLHCLRMSGVPTVEHATKTRGEMVVVKPVDGRGARGVRVFDWANPKMLQWIEEARAASPSGQIIFEHFVEGPQISTESIIWAGEAVFTGMTDRDYEGWQETTPYFVERGGWGPSRYEEKPEGRKIKELVQLLITKLGIYTGTVKCDVVLDSRRGGKPVIIEAALGRLSGGYMCSGYLPLAYNIDFIKAAIDVATGVNPVPLQPFNKWGCRKVRGEYQGVEKATNHPERGKFKMQVIKNVPRNSRARP